MERIVIPKIDLQTQEAEILKWHKNEGDKIDKDDLLLEILTEKTNVEIQAPAAGTLTQVMYRAGDVVKVGATIAYILLEGEAKEPAPEKPAMIRATPAAKALARQASRSIEEIHAALRKDPITEQDVKSYLASRGSQAREVGMHEKTVLPPVRQVIARRMVESARDKPHIYLFSDVPAQPLLDLKGKIKEEISLTDLFLQITARVLSELPAFNATIVAEAGELVLRKFRQVNLGFAVSTERGLVVPVLKNASQKSLVVLAKEKEQLIEKARAGRLSLEDISGGTFTLSNLGMSGIQSFTSIINPPEVAILSIGAIENKIDLAEGKVIAKPTLTLCLGMDHRALDGSDGARFLQRFRELMERPEKLA